jgi:protease YdgD
MTLRVIGLLCLALGLAQPAAAQDNSGLSALDRRERLFGWEAVGRIDIENGGFCTGTLIATDLVLTAAHCVFDPQGAPIDAARMTFRAGLADGTAIAESRVASTATDPAYHITDTRTPEVIRRDVALLQLQSPIPAALAAPFAVERPGNGRKVSVVSYAEGREEVLSWQRACSVLAKGEGLLAVDCDVTFGSSGAPVLDTSSGRGRIVSVISGGYRDEDGRAVTFGMELPRIVGELKAYLRAGKTTSVVATTAGRPAIRRIGAGDTTRTIAARFIKP